MKLSLIRHFVVFVLSAGGFAVVLACTGLLVRLVETDGLARYPKAERLAAAHFRLEALPTGYVSQHSAYRVADDLPGVLRWYARHHSLGHDEPQGALGGCLMMTKVEGQLFFQHSLAVTFCSQPKGTLVFVNRSLVVHR